MIMFNKINKLKNIFLVYFYPLIPNYTIGYGGYVPGVKSENVFGLTYGKTSYMSSANQFPKGID